MQWNSLTSPKLAVAGLVVSLVVAGAVLTPRPAHDTDPDAAQSALPSLLTQVYRAFALEDEAAIYATLAGAVTDTALTDLYLQRRAALVADHAEANETAITSVEIISVEPLPVLQADSVALRAAWRVVARIGHEGHWHERINLYGADLSLVVSNDGWRLSQFDLTSTARAEDLWFDGGE